MKTGDAKLKGRERKTNINDRAEVASLHQGMKDSTSQPNCTQMKPQPVTTTLFAFNARHGKGVRRAKQHICTANATAREVDPFALAMRA